MINIKDTIQSRAFFALLLAAVLLLGSVLTVPVTAGESAAGWRIRVLAGGASKGVESEITARAETLMRETIKSLGHTPSGPYTVYVTSRREDFERYAGEGIPSWAVAIYHKRSIVIRPEGLATNAGNFYGTLQHELVHGVLDHLFAGNEDALPRWLNEGLAVQVSGSWEIPEAWGNRREILMSALKKKRAFNFSEIENGFPRGEVLAQTAYAQSADFTGYLLERKGWPGMRDLLAQLASGAPRDDAFSAVYGQPMSGLVQNWEAGLNKPTVVFWILHFFTHFDLYIWVGMILLVILGFILVMSRRRKRYSVIDGGYDPDDDWDELDEEWDPDTYGTRPWRPGRRH